MNIKESILGLTTCIDQGAIVSIPDAEPFEGSLRVYIYNVNETLVDIIESILFNFSADLLDEIGYSIIPFVYDRNQTSALNPEEIVWRNKELQVAGHCAILDCMATNEELALAA